MFFLKRTSPDCPAASTSVHFIFKNALMISDNDSIDKTDYHIAFLHSWETA